jgi:hypothetical protein
VGGRRKPDRLPSSPCPPRRPLQAGGRERVIRSDDWHILSAFAVTTGGVAFAVLAGFGRLTADELVKIAALAARGFLLIKQREVRLVKLLEEFVPGDLFEIVVLRIRGIGKFDADYPGAVLRLRRSDGGGAPAAGLRPFADFVVVRRDLCLVSFSSVEASPPLMPTAGLSLETEAAGVEFS